MIEVRFHGRGGQGAVIASKVLAGALFHEGRWAQSFPAFGVERRGAPVTAFLRFDDKPIRIRCAIYEPQHLIVLDAGLVSQIDVTVGLRPDGTIIMNSARPAAAFGRMAERFNLVCVDAADIAVRHRLGSKTQPIVNTAICGAFAGATGLVSIEAVKEAIYKEVPIRRDANAEAAQEAFEAVRGGAAPARPVEGDARAHTHGSRRA